MVRSAGPGNHVDGNGLMPRVRKSGSHQRVQRLTIHGQRVDLGLASAEIAKLADARKVVADNRAIARASGARGRRTCSGSAVPGGAHVTLCGVAAGREVTVDGCGV